MEPLCPDCMGPLALATPATAKCTLHGGIYRILYVRAGRRSESDTPAALPSAGATVSTGAAVAADAEPRCRQHPGVVAPFGCARCATPICSTCAFEQASGEVFCPPCAQGGHMLGLALAPTPPRADVFCPRHPELPAPERCANCATLLCATCDFSFPGDLHFCPDCATSNQGEVSSKRKRNALIAYALAAFGSVNLLGIFVAGVLLAGKAQEAEAAGGVLAVLALGSNAVGLGLGLSAVDRRLSNPLWIWAAAIWNGLLLAAIVLLSIVGTFMG